LATTQDRRVRTVAAAGSGFLLAVLWFDLMFDVQLRRHPGERVPSEVLTSLSAYYGRVTTGARPMNRLVAAVMLVTLVALVTEVARGSDPAWRAAVSLGLAAVAIGIAGVRTVPAAVRLGRGTGTRESRIRLARTIYRDHVVCLALIASVVALQVLPLD
jgi:hypothetical protein